MTVMGLYFDKRLSRDAYAPPARDDLASDAFFICAETLADLI